MQTSYEALFTKPIHPVTEKKVLIITYYWPPSGGSGVQRWLKFVKYLPSYGYTPYVFTPENPAFDLKDPSLLNDVPPEAEVIHFPIWEPYNLFFKSSGKGARPTNQITRERTLFSRVATWLRGNVIIPDPRVFWVRPSIAFLSDFVRDNGIRMVVTTGPPHSVHLIGLGLKNRNPSLKWIADFRDPWSTWGLLDSLKTGGVARSIHRYLEGKVLRRADRVTTITPFYARKFAALSGRRVDLFTNGFDEADFFGFVASRPDTFTVRHVGIVNEKCDPRPCLTAIRDLMGTNAALRRTIRIEFIGDVHESVKSFVKADGELSAVTSFIPPVPHKELIPIYASTAMLLLILTGYRDAEGYMPGKLFEYIATGIPVLGVGPPHGDAAALINESRCGKMVDASAREEIKAFVESVFIRWERGDNGSDAASAHEKYSRRAVATNLAGYLDELLKPTAAVS